MPMNRRSFMKASGMAAALGVTGLAGCNGILGDDGASGAASYQYDPATLSQTGTRVFGTMQYGELYAMRDELPGSMSSNFETDSSSPISPEDFDVMTGVGGGQLTMETSAGAFFGSMAVTGSFDTEALSSEIESEGNATQTGEYQGYTLYEGENMNQGMPGGTIPGQPNVDMSAAFALSESALIFGVSADQATDLDVTGQQTVETMIDAEAGNAEMLAANSDYASELASKLGDGLLIVGGELDPDLMELLEQQAGEGTQGQMVQGLRAGGLSAAIDPSTTTYTVAIAYEDSGAAESSGLADLANFAGQQAADSPGINDVTANRDGATIVVTVEGDTETLLSQGQNQVPMGGEPVNAVPVDF